MREYYNNPYDSDVEENNATFSESNASSPNINVSDETRNLTKKNVEKFKKLVNDGNNELFTIDIQNGQPYDKEVVSVGYERGRTKFEIDVYPNGDVFFPRYPKFDDMPIKVMVDAPIYNINKIGFKKLYDRFLDYMTLVFENYGEEIRELENGESKDLLFPATYFMDMGNVQPTYILPDEATLANNELR